VHLDDRCESVLEAFEAVSAQNAPFRLRKHPQRRLRHDAEAAFTADEKAAEVRPDRGLRGRTPLEYSAVWKDSRQAKHLIAHRTVLRPTVPERVG